MQSARPLVGFKTERLSDSLFDSGDSSFVKVALSVAEALQADKWFYITSEGSLLIFLPKPASEPPLNGRNNLADVSSITDSLFGYEVPFAAYRTDFWRDYAHKLCHSHILVESDNGRAAGLNKEGFASSPRIPAYKLFLAFLNSLHFDKPFVYSAEGLSFIEDSSEAESVGKPFKATIERAKKITANIAKEPLAI